MLAFGLVAIGVVSLITMMLWNVLMPRIFGLPAISAAQALGLLVLGRLFFGGFHGGRGGRRGSRFAGDMTPEERERLRETMRARCGFEPPEAAPRM